MTQRPIDPVRPSSMELVFFYACPFCHYELPIVAPLQPTMAACSKCNGRFPIIPVDESSIHFIKIMLEDGAAAVDADYL